MLTSMKSLATALACILAVSAIATPEAQPQVEKRSISDRITDPLGFITVDAVGGVDAVVDSIDTSKSDASMDLKGFTVVSSFSNAGITFNTWSQSSDSTETKRSNWSREILDIPLEKRATNIEGRFCATQCAYQNYTKADPNDCRNVYQGIYSTTGVFHLGAKQAMTVNGGNCAVVIINNSGQEIVYDYWDLAGTGQWLNGDCVLNGATVGVCLYSGVGSTVRDGIYTSVNHPGFYSS